jgi:hypothetical protein
MRERNLLAKPGLTPFDVRIERNVPSSGISPRDTQNEGQTPAETHGKLCGGRQSVPPRALCAQHPAQGTKEEGGGEPTCA